MTEKRTRINRQIRVSEIRLIDENNQQSGIVKIEKALEHAELVGLDLVEISPNAKPPVCRIMDFGKYQFEQSKKRAAQKKKQRLIHVKEIKFRPGTGVGDYQVKLKKIADFLERGDKVKVSLRFRGREMQHARLGLELFNRIQQDLENIKLEQELKLEGKQITMVIMKGKKVEATKKTKDSRTQTSKNDEQSVKS